MYEMNADEDVLASRARVQQEFDELTARYTAALAIYDDYLFRNRVDQRTLVPELPQPVEVAGVAIGREPVIDAPVAAVAVQDDASPYANESNLVKESPVEIVEPATLATYVPEVETAKQIVNEVAKRVQHKPSKKRNPSSSEFPDVPSALRAAPWDPADKIIDVHTPAGMYLIQHGITDIHGHIVNPEYQNFFG